MVVTNLPAERRSQIDTEKWLLDPNTGEYHRIRRRHQGGFVTDSWTYGTRKFQYYERRRYLGLHIAGGLGVFAVALVVYLYLLQQGDIVASIAMYLFILFGGVGAVAAVYSSCEWLYRVLSKDDFIGPPPIPRPGREQVEQQKVHGEGRMMSREEMDRALRGGAPLAQKQKFED